MIATDAAIAAVSRLMEPGRTGFIGLTLETIEPTADGGMVMAWRAEDGENHYTLIRPDGTAKRSLILNQGELLQLDRDETTVAACPPSLASMLRKAMDRGLLRGNLNALAVKLGIAD